MQPLEALLDPLCEPLPAQTLPPIDYGQEPNPAPKTAVIVCHGMGQQVRFQTLNDIVQLLRDQAARQNGIIREVATRLVLFRNAAGVCTDQLGRAELTLVRPDGSPRTVHIYEAYWAPLTEGKVVIRDVMWFLLTAGFHGVIAGLRGFRRLMFGNWVPLNKAVGTSVMFLFALAVVLSLVVINSALGLLLAGNTLRGGAAPAWPNPTLVAALIRDIALAEIVAIPLAIIVGLVHWHRNWFLRRHRLSNRRWHLPKVIEWLLVGWVWTALVVTVLVAGVTIYHIVRYRGEGGEGGVVAWQLIVVGGLAFLTSYVLRSFLLQYFGDVVIYISAHAVSKFNEIRNAIQTIGFEVGRAVYALPRHYDRCIVVGHSLGAVVAYDLYNRMVNEGAGTNWCVQERTKLLLTFGAPLDKTAFVFRAQQSKEADVREALVAAVQPMIVDTSNRPAAWVNIYSQRDWISGALDYYERPTDSYVENVADPEATIPLVAHTQYWKNLELATRLYSAL